MNLRNISRRAVVAGATTALAAAALVGVTGTTADAATGSAAYTCTNPSPLVPPIPVTVSATGDIPVNSLPTGYEVKGIPIGVGVDFTVPGSTTSTLSTFGVKNVGISGATFALALGSTNIPINGVTTDAPVPVTSGEDLVLPTTSGMLGDFTTPAPGTYDISLPQSFDVTLTTDSPLASTLAVTCALNEGQTTAILPFTITQQSATIAGKAPGKVKKNKSFPIAVTVKGDSLPATGQVVATEKGKSLGKPATLKNGKATITVKGLKPGLHTIDLKYKGDTNTAAATTPLLVNVKK